MRNLLSDFFNQLWTLLGMFIAWVVLDGSAKVVVGWAIVATLVLWTITLSIREGDE